MLLLFLSAAMVTASPIRSNHADLYNRIPAASIMPLQARQHRASYIGEGNTRADDIKLRKTEQDLSRDNQCKYRDMFAEKNCTRAKFFVLL